MNVPTKQEVIAGLHASLDELSRKVDELRVQAHLARADARDALNQQLAALEKRRTELQRDVHHLREHSGEAFQTLAAGCRRSWTDLRDALDTALGQLKR